MQLEVEEKTDPVPFGRPGITPDHLPQGGHDAGSLTAEQFQTDFHNGDVRCHRAGQP